MTISSRTDHAKRITWIGFFVNLVLTLFKIFAGVVGHSAAMIADAVHSLSDFATDIVVLLSFRIVSKPADKSHDYGHGKYETLASAVIGIALFFVGVGIFISGIKNIWFSLHDREIGSPGLIALIAAFVSIIAKEWLYRITARVGKKINSQAVIANAWHHRSDAFSSIGTVIGIGGAILLGKPWHLLDPLAAVIVSFFIMKVAVEITIGSVKELTEESLDSAVEDEIIRIAQNVQGVITPHELRTRRVGSAIAIDFHITVKPNLTIQDAHEISTVVEAKLGERFGRSSVR